MLHFLFTMIILSLTSFSHAFFVTFDPPPQWSLANNQASESSVYISLIDSKYSAIRPCMNLSFEKIDIPLENYIQKVSKLHQIDRKNSWSSLGYIETKFGKAHLAQIDRKAPQGDLRLLQSIGVYKNYAVIMTAISRREESSAFYQLFLRSFSSLLVAESPLESLASAEEKNVFQAEISQFKHQWQTFLNKQPKANKPIVDLIATKEFRKTGWQPLEKALNKKISKQNIVWTTSLVNFLKEELISSSTQEIVSLQQSVDNLL